MCCFFSCRITVLISLLLVLGAPLLQAESSQHLPALGYRESIEEHDPMGLYGLADSRVASILRDYYRASFGGVRGWDEVESIRFEGILRVPQGELRFVAFKKKPDYCKVVLSGGGGVRIVMSYDGVDAWQLNGAESSEPSAMPAREALNFIRDAPTAGHLLYPMLPGKRIELLGECTVGEYACYDLRVHLPNGQQVSYAIDQFDFVERQQRVVNAVSGATEVTTHAAIELVGGIAVPMSSVLTIDGEFVHEVQMRSVEFDQGLMPWMFARPAGSYAPGSEAADAAVPSRSHVSGDSPVDSEPPVAETFGLGDMPVSMFEATRFPDLDAETTQSILDDVSDL
jgi:hypothetical protein